jgi:hypothetical protein
MVGYASVDTQFEAVPAGAAFAPTMGMVIPTVCAFMLLAPARPRLA